MVTIEDLKGFLICFIDLDRHFNELNKKINVSILGTAILMQFRSSAFIFYYFS